MQILANALPGFRDLRGPLVAGYLWLLFGWLLVHGSVDTTEEPWAALTDLGDAAGPIGVSVAASVAAYLIGSVSQALSGLLRGNVRWIVGRLGGRLARIEIPGGLRVEFRGVDQEPDRARGYDPSQVVFDPWIRDIVAPALERAARYAAEFALPDPREWKQYRSEKDSDTDEPLRRAQLLDDRVQRLQREVRRELDLPATLLVGDQPTLFAEVDRLRAEGELRLAVAPPLVALSIELAFYSLWWLAILPLAGVLVAQGVERYEDSSKQIRDAMSFRKVPSGAVRNFEAWLDGVQSERSSSLAAR